MSIVLMLSLACLCLCACGKQPQQADASPSKEIKLDETVPQTDSQTSQVQEADSYMPSPMQDNEYKVVVLPLREAKQILLHCPKVSQVPVVNGVDDDVAWTQCTPIETLDFSSQRTIQLAAVHDGKTLFMMARYPDHAPSVTHKSWSWDAKEGFYKQNIDREDMFVIKWSMCGNDAQLALRDVVPHVADVWFWKACRTNLAGYFDDKQHFLTAEEFQKSLQLTAKDGHVGYLRRIGDQGRQAYSEHFPSEFKSQYQPRYAPEVPVGSRGDVHGKGQWGQGYWTLELQRLLDTGHDDDLSLQVGNQYLFGVSCYENAGTGIDDQLTQPLYRTGDMFDRILLVID